jgi:pimeloyl-ACP methyl ester carboxylesterase
MRNLAGTLTVFILLFTALGAGAQNDSLVNESGELDGVPYKIRIPEEWNGSLVMYAHGYKPRGAKWNPLHYSLASVFLDRGFALAESAYSRQGWAVEEALAETEDLRAHFTEIHGKPDSTFVVGFSMGGLITLATIETYPDAYDGAVPMCGPLAPSLVFMKENIFDHLVTFEALFGKHLPEGKVPLLEAEALDAAEVEAALASDEELAVKYAGSRGMRRESLASIISMSHMIYAELADRAGGNPIDNRGTIYSDFEPSIDLNEIVPRYAADEEAFEYLKRNYTPTGRLSGPVLALHTTYDAGVPPCLPAVYSSTVGLLDGGEWFVQMRAEADGHCRFSPEQIGKAFDMMREWASAGSRPEPGVVR